jgi:hypothetical protein
METKTNQGKFRFWMYWTLLSLAIIPLTYIVSEIVVLLVHGAFGFDQMEGGTYLSQTAMQVAGGAVIGLGTGLYQRPLLKKFFHISPAWIYTLMIGFAVTELIICLILWKMNLNRWELRFIEFKPLPEALFFACAGLLIGLLQWRILRRHFAGSIIWIIASTTGWGICILITVISIWAFILGALLYGLITGTALVWIIKSKKAI